MDCVLPVFLYGRESAIWSLSHFGVQEKLFTVNRCHLTNPMLANVDGQMDQYDE